MAAHPPTLDDLIIDSRTPMLDKLGIDYSKDAFTQDGVPILLCIPLLGQDGKSTIYLTRWRGIDCSDPELAILFRDAFNITNKALGIFDDLTATKSIHRKDRDDVDK